MIARALAQTPRLMVLDEITAFLDLPSRVEIMALLRARARQKGQVVLLSSHDLDLSLQLSDSVWLLDGAGGFSVGTPDELRRSGAVGRAFDTDAIRFSPAQGAVRDQDVRIRVAACLLPRDPGDPPDGGNTGSSASEAAKLQCLQHGAGPVADAELRHHAGRMVLDRALGNAQGFRDLTVAVPASHQPQDFKLARCERIRALDNKLAVKRGEGLPAVPDPDGGAPVRSPACEVGRDCRGRARVAYPGLPDEVGPRACGTAGPCGRGDAGLGAVAAPARRRRRVGLPESAGGGPARCRRRPWPGS